MRKRILSLAFVAAASVSGIAAAQTPAPTPSPLTGNITLVSDYRFRGITQTWGQPAIQGGFDYSHASGIYLGNWNSNVSETAGFPNGNLEMDFYGGFKKAFGDLGLDVGAIYYYYPGTNAAGNGVQGVANFDRTPAAFAGSGKVSNFEVYLGASWKWLSAKLFYALDDYFSVPGTSGTTYWDFAGNYEMGSGWTLIGHVGRLETKDYSSAKYTDYKLGVTKDFNGWLAGASLIGTNAKGDCSATSVQPYCFFRIDGTSIQTKDAGKPTIVLSFGKTF
jgi:uncharacterized protein (TIGR02001 family)